jgi:hypothetical protein
MQQWWGAVTTRRLIQLCQKSRIRSDCTISRQPPPFHITLCQLFLVLWLSMLKYVTTLTSSRNKKMSGQHLFLPSKVVNDVV